MARQKWTTLNIPDLAGKVMVVTGANSGIGYETSKELARKGAHTILACRNLSSAQSALEKIKTEIPYASAEVIHLDLASLASIRSFAREFMRKYKRLDVLINNAGIMKFKYDTTADGFERHFGTNYLGHFALTGLLVGLLLKTSHSRVVNVSSIGHRYGSMNFLYMNNQDGQRYNVARAYSNSKLANLFFTYELQRRYQHIGSYAIAVAAHPGVCQTNLTNHIAGKWFYEFSHPFQALLLPSAAMGALPTLRAAVDAEVQGGQYYGPGGFIGPRRYPVVVESSQASHDIDDGKKLWEYSVQLTGVLFEQLKKSD